MAPLEREMQIFEEHRKELLGSQTGKFVLIRGEELVATYDTEADAINEGYRRFGNVPFLVKKVTATDEPANFVSGIVNV